MKLLKTLFVISSLALSACMGAPKKPSIELCLIDFPRLEAICGTTSGESIKSASDMTYENMAAEIMASPTVSRKPLSAIDKATALIPKEWEKLKNYLDALEDYAQSQCGQH